MSKGNALVPGSNRLDKRGEKAFTVYREILFLKKGIQVAFIELGRVFKKVRDEELYKDLDYESFEAFLGAPEICMSRSSVFNYIHIYELYIEKLGFKPELLTEIGNAKLTDISPVVEKDPQEWIFKAKEQSRSDLKEEVALAQGRTFKPRTPVEAKDQDPGDSKDYLSWVKAHSCVTCNQRVADPHHFPRTKGAGGRDRDRIPLCRECHSSYHQDPQKFLWENKDKIFAYFYDLFLLCWDRVYGEKS